VIISPSLPSIGTILNNGTWTSPTYDYYIHQAGKGYPVFAGRRYQRGHGLGSIFGGLFKAAMPLLKKGAKTLGREALKTGLNIAGDVYKEEISGDNTVSNQTLG
jgi:hypothetical protein